MKMSNPLKKTLLFKFFSDVFGKKSSNDGNQVEEPLISYDSPEMRQRLAGATKWDTVLEEAYQIGTQDGEATMRRAINQFVMHDDKAIRQQKQVNRVEEKLLQAKKIEQFILGGVAITGVLGSKFEIADLGLVTAVATPIIAYFRNNSALLQEQSVKNGIEQSYVGTREIAEALRCVISEYVEKGGAYSTLSKTEMAIQFSKDVTDIQNGAVSDWKSRYSQVIVNREVATQKQTTQLTQS